MSDLRVGPPPAASASPTPDELRLRKVAQQLEGVFVQQLFMAMRETVPHDGLTSGGAGEEMFQGMMDEHIATQLPDQWENGLAAAVYRQLRGSLNGAPVDATANPGAGESR